MRNALHLKLFIIVCIIALTAMSGNLNAQTNILFQTGFDENNTGGDVTPGEGWTNGFTYVSSNVKGPGDHAELAGTAAIKFIRGQEDKVGFLISPAYERIHTLSFYLFIESPDATADLKIETVTDGSTTLLDNINESNSSDSEWTLFSYEIIEAAATEIVFTPTLTVDGDARIWIDDLSISEMDEGLAINQTDLNSEIILFPTVVDNQLSVNLGAIQATQITLYNQSGQIIKRIVNPSQVSNLNVSELSKGIYLVQVDSEAGLLNKKFVKN